MKGDKKMNMVDEFKEMCKIIENSGQIIENKQRMLKALEQEQKKDYLIYKKMVEDFDEKDWQKKK